MAKRKKIRTDLRKNRTPRARKGDFTRRWQADEATEDKLHKGERLSGKGEMTRKRTVMSLSTDEERLAGEIVRELEAGCKPGRVLSVFGLTSTVQDEQGQVVQCATRRILKTLSTDQRHVVAAGDKVLFRVESTGEGFIERVEPRSHVLRRTSKSRQHIIVANVDQMLIVASAAEPYLKPNLIDRFLVCAEQEQMKAVIVINKLDLIEPADLMPLIGVYSRMGYVPHLISTKDGRGIERLRRELAGRASAVVGQSGVGKSSILNAVDPEWNLKVNVVSSENQKGKHTTTTARLLALSCGGYVVDTPGIRQFQLWDVISEEVAGYFRDLRPYVSLCRFPNCTHRHEAGCAIKDAVADGQLDARRYESYCQLYEGMGEEE